MVRGVLLFHLATGDEGAAAEGLRRLALDYSPQVATKSTADGWLMLAEAPVFEAEFGDVVSALNRCERGLRSRFGERAISLDVALVVSDKVVVGSLERSGRRIYIGAGAHGEVAAAREGNAWNQVTGAPAWAVTKEAQQLASAALEILAREATATAGVGGQP